MPRYRVGEIVWYWPAGVASSLPPLAAMITGEQQSNVYAIHSFAPPGTGPHTDAHTAVDLDDPQTRLANETDVHRFRKKGDTWNQ